MRYFLDNQDDAWAVDKKGNEFLLSKNRLIPAKKGSIDPMWGGITEEEAKKYAWKNK